MTMILDDVEAVKLPVDESVNYVPDEAIDASEKARKGTKPRLVPPIPDKAPIEKKSDPYNEDRVAPNVPTKEQVKGTPPDRTVNPG